VTPSRIATRWLQALTATGDCYEANGRYFIEQTWLKGITESSLTLVHGEVTGGGGQVLGINYGHAWLLDGNTVLDFSNGRNLRVPKAVYYRAGNVWENDNWIEYTPREAAENMLDYGVWGPWDLHTSTGL
jgi:hypothetical protein